MAEAACAAPAAYRPRRAPESPLYRLAETHHGTFKQVYDERFTSVYGPWRAVIGRTLFAFLDCGIEARGFARVRCDACWREFRVALSCKTRGFCLSCHAKRAVLWAEWLAGEVLAPVPHHQWVFTLWSQTWCCDPNGISSSRPGPGRLPSSYKTTWSSSAGN